MTDPLDPKIAFLERDLFDALEWMLVGAVIWTVPNERRPMRHHRVVSMYAVLVQARALYEFYFDGQGRGDDARAVHFDPQWPADSPPAQLKDYLGQGKAANKRVFHLVYERSAHSGGAAPDESDHLKNQVLTVAKALVEVTRGFIAGLNPTFATPAQRALDMALQEAGTSAAEFRVENPFK